MTHLPPLKPMDEGIVYLQLGVFDRVKRLGKPTLTAVETVEKAVVPGKEGQHRPRHQEHKKGDDRGRLPATTIRV